jgi:hypothetical protein
MAGIFISYRRSESRYAAGRLADDLAEAFGAQSIFRDIEGIDPGVDFEQALDKALRACVVMLVLIGPRWLALEDGQGGRRLDRDGDWIRQEIETALSRDVRVIPVLLEGAPLPAADDLPESLRPLVRRQAFDLADGRWKGDVQRLVDALARVPGLERQAPPAPPPLSAPPAPSPSPPAPAGRFKPMLIGAVAALIALALIGALYEEDTDFVDLPGGSVVVPGGGDAGGRGDVDPVDGGRAAPDISGLWRTHSGEIYHFEQDGSDVAFFAEAAGQHVGDGQGRLEGRVLRVNLTMMLGGQPTGVANCDLELAPDGRSMTGDCRGPGGVTPAQIFR